MLCTAMPAAQLGLLMTDWKLLLRVFLVNYDHGIRPFMLRAAMAPSSPNSNTLATACTCSTTR